MSGLNIFFIAKSTTIIILVVCYLTT